MKPLMILALLVLQALPLSAQSIDSSAGKITVTRMADGFKGPWSLAFLPDGGFLVTEKRGRLWRVGTDGRREEITGLPEIKVQGQGGLLDILVPRDFASTREILFTYVKAQKGGSGTALARAVLPQGQTRLRDVETLFEMAPGSSGGRHFGSRIVESREGQLFITIGERGDRPSAQDLASHNGAIIRLNRDGSVPSDNPFVGLEGAQPEIWSYGHRNPQGAALDLRGQLWAVEHGAKGGDEVNRIRKGANYGWPVIAYGRHYSGFKIGEGTAKPGMEQPAFFWDPSIAPSGMMIYSGRLFPEWRGDTFIGSLKYNYISRISGTTLKEVEQLKSSRTARVRDIREAADGSIWFIAEDNGSVFRITPKN